MGLATISSRVPSICDALLAPMPGALTFEINKRRLAGVLTISDEMVRAAMRFAFYELKLVVEPGGAAALAVILARRIETKGAVTALVLSGGNVDGAFYSDMLRAD